jgi:K+-transporting ATPase ATPase A chain
MTAIGWTQILLYALVIFALTKPLGLYMFRVFEGDQQPLRRFFGAQERFCYRLCGIDPKKEHTWKQYAAALLVFSAIGLLVSYAIFRLQHRLPLNPQKLVAVSPHLSWNTAVSFTTNTNYDELPVADGRSRLA